jgi:radical SAM superfamily enzyme YgiQ (UPF0313 family)
MIGMAYAPESGSERTRELIKKEMHTSRLFASIQAAVKARLNVAVFLIVGFPHDTRELLAENLAFVDRLVAAGITDLVLGYYMNLPGTELFDSQYDAGKVKLDRAYFGHILQSTELFPSISYCARVGRLGLAWWKYRLYLRFFLANWRSSRGVRQVSSARRALSGLWNREVSSKLPAAIRHSLRTLANTIKVRLARRWLPAREERALIARWDAIYREIRAQQLAGGVSIAVPDVLELHRHNVDAAMRKRHATMRVAVLSSAPAGQLPGSRERSQDLAS